MPYAQVRMTGLIKNIGEAMPDGDSIKLIIEVRKNKIGKVNDAWIVAKDAYAIIESDNNDIIINKESKDIL